MPKQKAYKSLKGMQEDPDIATELLDAVPNLRAITDKIGGLKAV